MKSLVRAAERILSNTPLEQPAKWLWSELSSIGRPRARQSLQYDRETVAVLKRIARPDSNCVDVGCHRGSLMRTIIQLAPQGRHFGFEPIPHLAQNLQRSFPGVTIKAMALSDHAGQAQFCHVADNPGLSGFKRMGHVSADAQVQQITVEVDTLDHVLPQGLPITFIKIDVEGAQLEVLRGARETLERSRPHVVFEHGALAREGYGTTSEMVYDLLVGECRLNISLMSSWLAGGDTLSREGFAGQVGTHAGSQFCFLAHP